MTDRQVALNAAVQVWRTRVEASSGTDTTRAAVTVLSAHAVDVIRLAEQFEAYLEAQELPEVPPCP